MFRRLIATVTANVTTTTSTVVFPKKTVTTKKTTMRIYPNKRPDRNNANSNNGPIYSVYEGFTEGAMYSAIKHARGSTDNGVVKTATEAPVLQTQPKDTDWFTLEMTLEETFDD